MNFTHNSTGAPDINWQYALVNAVILTGGVALNRLGAKLAGRRRRRRDLARAAR